MRSYILGVISGVLILSACGGNRLGVKIYWLDPATSQLVRKQDNEYIPVSEAKDFYCLGKDDLRKVIDFYQSCLDTGGPK